MRETWPSTMPFRVSTSAVWPIWMSLVCVSAMRSSAFSSVGLATRARLAPAADLLTEFDREDLQHAGHAGLDLEVVELLQAQFIRRLALIDVRFLRREL